MAGKTQNTYPADDELVRMVREAGTRCAVADEIGVSYSSLKHHIDREPGLRDKIDKAAKDFKAEKQATRSTDRPVRSVDEVPEEDKLRHQVKDLETKLRTAQNATTADALILDRFTAAFGGARPRFSPLTIPKRTRAHEAHEHLLLFSDAHANEVVSAEETMGVNEYNWQIMLRRMARIQRAVLSFQENRPYPIRKLNVAMLGDNVSGDIHQELVVTNELPHEESVVQMGLDTAVWLEEFVPHYETISVSGIVGNHPRRTKKPEMKGKHNNSDWTMCKFIEAYLRKNNSFDFFFPKAPHAAVTIAERWRFLFLHGDGIRSTMVDVPWGGIIRYLGKLARLYQSAGDPIDYFGMGHWHTATAVGAGGSGTKTFINGNIKGADEYSIQRFGGGDPPQQVLLTVHPRKGVTDVSYIDCEDHVPAAEVMSHSSR